MASNSNYVICQEVFLLFPSKFALNMQTKIQQGFKCNDKLHKVKKFRPKAIAHSMTHK